MVGADGVGVSLLGKGDRTLGLGLTKVSLIPPAVIVSNNYPCPGRGEGGDRLERLSLDSINEEYRPGTLGLVLSTPPTTPPLSVSLSLSLFLSLSLSLPLPTPSFQYLCHPAVCMVHGLLFALLDPEGRIEEESQ